MQHVLSSLALFFFSFIQYTTSNHICIPGTLRLTCSGARAAFFLAVARVPRTPVLLTRQLTRNLIALGQIRYIGLLLTSTNNQVLLAQLSNHRRQQYLVVY